MMASAPPPYTEQANPPINPNYPAGGYQPYPPAGGYVDPSKNVQAGYPGYAQPPQPQPGYPPAQYPPQQTAQPVMSAPAVQQPQAAQQTIVITQGPVATGNCPVCRAGNITEDFTCCGICLAIFCFPIGLICCLLMKDRRCTRCGARV